MFIDSDIKRQDIPMLIAVSCLSPVRTQTCKRHQRVSRIIRSTTDLDSSHLKGVDSVRYTVLQLVLDSSRTKQEHLFLNQLGGLIEGFTSAIDGGCSLIIYRRPLTILRF
jgi:hypothetical protein